MKKKLVYLTLLAVIVTFSMAISFFGEKQVLRVSDGKKIAFAEMVKDIRNTDVVLVGEIHDSSRIHRMQLDIIRALHESDSPVAVGLEMFRSENQKELDRWVSGEMTAEKFIPVYYSNWSMPWPLYSEIFLYAREHGIPMIGLNIPDGISRKIAREGFDSLNHEEKKHLPPGVTCTVDPTYMEFIKRAYAGHAGHDGGFVNFCEAQMIWDKSMAWNIDRYLKENSGMTVVVLAGVGHAWKRGIAGQLDDLNPQLSSRSLLPLIPDKIDMATVGTEDADYVLLN